MASTIDPAVEKATAELCKSCLDGYTAGFSDEKWAGS